MKKHVERGFTLMELMVVIVIVAILAAVAVPLYINYVKDAQRTEAKGAIGAIISGEQAFYQKSALTGTPHYSNSLPALEAAGVVDVTEAKAKWTFTLTSTAGATPDADGFTVLASNKSDATVKTQYNFVRSTGGTFDDNPSP